MKKILLLFMAVLTLGVTARASDGDKFTVEPLSYKVLSESDSTVSVIGYFSLEQETELIIPSEVERGSVKYSVISIDEEAFRGRKNLTSVTINASLTSFGVDAFWNCENLTSVTINGSLTSIGKNAFRGCTSLTSVTINGSLTSIDYGAFTNCISLTSVDLPESVTSIGDGAFWECSSLTSVTIPESVTSIGKNAFIYCTSLKSVTIPESVTTINEKVFSDCTGLTSVTISKSVTLICWTAFSDCSALKDIYCWAVTPPVCERYAFGGANSSAILHVPGESVEAYKAAPNWDYFFNVVGDLSGIEGIEADNSNAPTEYFNLNGVRVDKPENGLYIKRQGGKATKVLVK